jgi:hypothetical protein
MFLDDPITSDLVTRRKRVLAPKIGTAARVSFPLD